MMITARRNECCLAPKALGQLQAEHTTIKPKGAVKISDLEMHMTDANLRINCLHRVVCDMSGNSAMRIAPRFMLPQQKSRTDLTTVGGSEFHFTLPW